MQDWEKLKTASIFNDEASPSLFQRVAAKITDFTAAAVLYVIGQWALPYVGGLLGAAYIGLADGWNGRSYGKRIFGLRTVDSATALPCTIGGSFIRNLPFVLFFLATYVPLLWGLLLLINCALVGFEFYILFQLRSGMRLGDVLARTEVARCAEPALNAVQPS